MSLFTLLTPQPSEGNGLTNGLARSLSKNEKLAVSVMMQLVVNRYGNRRLHPQETRYIQAISQRVLGLPDIELDALRFAHFDPFCILGAMAEPQRRSVAGVVYDLATLVQDPAVVGRGSVVMQELGYSMRDWAPRPLR